MGWSRRLGTWPRWSITWWLLWKRLWLCWSWSRLWHVTRFLLIITRVYSVIFSSCQSLTITDRVYSVLVGLVLGLCNAILTCHQMVMPCRFGDIYKWLCTCFSSRSLGNCSGNKQKNPKQRRDFQWVASQNLWLNLLAGFSLHFMYCAEVKFKT